MGVGNSSVSSKALQQRVATGFRACSVSMPGFRIEMEDAHVIHFLRHLPRADAKFSTRRGRLAEALQGGASPESPDAGSVQSKARWSTRAPASRSSDDECGSLSPSGLFGVFDGHAGSVASTFCAATLPRVIHDFALRPDCAQPPQTPVDPDETWKKRHPGYPLHLRPDPDIPVFSVNPKDLPSARPISPNSGKDQVAEALRCATLALDAEFFRTHVGAEDGTTCVYVLAEYDTAPTNLTSGAASSRPRNMLGNVPGDASSMVTSFARPNKPKVADLRKEFEKGSWDSKGLKKKALVDTLVKRGFSRSLTSDLGRGQIQVAPRELKVADLRKEFEKLRLDWKGLKKKALMDTLVSERGFTRSLTLSGEGRVQVAPHDSNPVTWNHTIVNKDGPEVLLHVANCGDSRALLLRPSTGEWVALTADHKPGNPEEKARIKAAGGYVAGNRVNSNLALSRAIGDVKFKQSKIKTSAIEQEVIALPDITSRRARPGDVLLVACDGYFEKTTNALVMSALGMALKETDGDLVEALRFLTDFSLSCGSQDNMTAILVEFTGSTPLPHETDTLLRSSGNVEVVERVSKTTTLDLLIPGPYNSQKHRDEKDASEFGKLFRKFASENGGFTSAQIDSMINLEKGDDFDVPNVQRKGLRKFLGPARFFPTHVNKFLAPTSCETLPTASDLLQNCLRRGKEERDLD